MTDLAVIRKAVRDALRPRRLVTALLMIVLPAAVALISRAVSSKQDWDPALRYDELFVALVLGFALTILSVVYGTGIIGDELEQRTIIYLLLRPLPRWRILLARFVVSVASVAVITVLSTLVLAASIFGITHIGDADLALDLRALLVGSVAYGSVFLLLGALLPRPLIYGLLFVFGWEDIVTLLPGSFSHLSVMSYVRVIAAREVGSGDGSNPLSKGPAGFLFNLGSATGIDITVHEAYLTLAGIALACLGAAIWAFSTREYVPREEGD